MHCLQVRLVAFVIFLAFGAAVQAQSLAGEWTGDFALPGVTGPVYALAEHGDRLYVGGNFEYAGSKTAFNIAVYDVSGAWAPLGDGIHGAVYALAVTPEGVLYAGGEFSAAGGVPAANVAQYDPAKSEWKALGEGLNGNVDALAVKSDGTLYVGGRFDSAGGTSAKGLARWNGAEWSALGEVGENSSEGASSLAFDGDVLYVGGRFSTAGGVTTENVALFDTATMTWAALGGGVDRAVLGGVDALVVAEDGVYVGGIFDEAIQPDGSLLPVNNVARWDPNTEAWSALGEGTESLLSALAFGSDGLLYAGGEWLEDVLRSWDGEAWSSVDLGPIPVDSAPPVKTILATSGRLYVGHMGYFFFEGNNPNSFLHFYEPANGQWGILDGIATNGLNDDVLALATAPDGSTYAGGRFHFAGTERADHIVHWDGGVWERLGQGADDVVQALLHTEGDITYAGGLFGEVYQPDGTPVATSRVAAWHPSASTWRGLGGGVTLSSAPGIVYALAESGDGTVYVGGGFDTAVQPDGSTLGAENLARWDPDAEMWEALPEGHGIEVVHALAEDAAGALYVGGYRVVPSTFESRARVVRLDPETESWTTLREWGFASVRGLSIVGNPLSDGALYVGTYSHGVWQWAGEAWTDLGGPEFVYSLALNGDPEAGGELYAGGLNQDTSGPYVQRWNGESWARLGSGLTSFVSPPLVYALAVGEAEAEGKAALWVGGEFVTAGGEPASCIARWETDDFDTDVEQGGAAPQALGLEAYPNPSSGPLVVRYTLPSSSAVRLTVYDVLGREVAVLSEGVQAAGAHEVHFERGGLASGVYLVQLRSEGSLLIQRITLVR